LDFLEAGNLFLRWPFLFPFFLPGFGDTDAPEALRTAGILTGLALPGIIPLMTAIRAFENYCQHPNLNAYAQG